MPDCRPSFPIFRQFADQIPLFLFQWPQERLDEGDVPTAAHPQRAVLPHTLPADRAYPGTLFSNCSESSLHYRIHCCVLAKDKPKFFMCMSFSVIVHSVTGRKLNQNSRNIELPAASLML